MTVSNDVMGLEELIAGSADMNFLRSVEGVYRYVSPACHRLFGWGRAELEGRREDDFVHPDDLAALRASRAELAPACDFVTTSYRFLCRDATYRWTETTSRLVKAGRSSWVVSTMRDIAARQRRTVALEVLASTDPLTGLANRTVLMDRLHQGLLRLDRSPGVLAVLYVDLDRFKIVNDSLGHRTGDQILLKMAERLTHHLRPADTLARLGGDEFVIVVETMTSQDAAVALADRIIKAGRQPFQVGDEEFVCTLSVGIACTADSHGSADDLLRDADLALYRAKDRGRDRREVFDEDLRTKAVGRLVTERMLRGAIREQRFVVEYQPIVDLRVGRLVGVEALIRIRDRDHGLLLPGTFLAVAEETGLLIDIDELVLADAVKSAAVWHRRFPGTGFSEAAINVSARHLADAGFARAVIDQLDAAGVPHHNLQVEVTEQVLMEASNSAMTGLRRLRDTGVQVGLDDFGTGYSSLAYLRQFPLDFVKIDQCLIHDLSRRTGERAIVSAIVGLAHALDLTVVAEGVETLGQLRILETLGCDRGQGFLFAPSLGLGEIDELIIKGLDPALQPAAPLT